MASRSHPLLPAEASAGGLLCLALVQFEPSTVS